MLGLADDTLEVVEPFNIEPWAYALDGLARHWFTYAPGLPQEAALRAFDKVVRRRTRKVFQKNQPQYWVPALRRGRLLIKDPIASLSARWLANNFDLEVIVLVRHPAAFAASLKRLHWSFPFSHFLAQEALMRDHLEAYRDEMAAVSDGIVDQAALVWKCLYGVLSTYLDTNPGWTVATHERLSADPLPELKRLYKSMGLDWTAAVAKAVARYTGRENPVGAPPGTVHQLRRDSAANISHWKKMLTEAEVARVYDVTYPVSRLYYSDEDW